MKDIFKRKSCNFWDEEINNDPNSNRMVDVEINKLPKRDGNQNTFSPEDLECTTLETYKNNIKNNKAEMVNHPNHYQSGNGIEVIDVIEAFNLNFNLGNAIKYCLRCNKKFNMIEDLEKAKWYLEREIRSLKNKGK